MKVLQFRITMILFNRLFDRLCRAAYDFGLGRGSQKR